MIVTLDAQLFAPGIATTAQLNELFIHAYDGRHHIEIDEADPNVQAWLSQRDAGWREAWEEARDLALRASTMEVLRQAVRVVPGERNRLGESPPALGVSTALRVLRLPLRVLVENARTDGDLFLRGVSVLGGRYHRLRQYLDRGWIEFETAGGIEEMAKTLDARGGDPAWRLRRYALFDSDALRSKEPSPTAQSLERRCARIELPHHCLRRRSVENYLPPAAIERLWADRGGVHSDDRLRRARSYRDLHEPGGRVDRRHHFAMKKGFEGAQHDEALYAAVPAGRRAALKHGFGDAILEVFKAPHPNWERWLRDDGQHEEIGAMLDDVFAFR